MLSDRMFMAATPKAVQGQQAYTTAGSYTFTVPAGVTSVCVLCVGGGGGSGQQRPGVGGSLAYTNNLSVTPGNSITVVVGAGGTGSNVSSSFQAGGDSSFGSGPSVRAKGGASIYTNVGDVTQLGGSEGGFGDGGGGGGGAAGYSGAGGYGGDYTFSGGTAGVSGAGGGGGGGGGGFYYPDFFSPGVGQFWAGAGGGGVGILGTGSNGAGGGGGSTSSGPFSGGGGSGGSSGGGASGDAGTGGAYGGGAGGVGYNENTSAFGTPANGGVGAVRIIWGAGRSYPSNAANV